MNQQKEENKLQQASMTYSKKEEYGINMHPHIECAFIAGAKSEAAKEYWQSLTTPASKEVEGEDSARDQNNRMRDWFYERTGIENGLLSQHMKAIDKMISATPSKPHTVEEGQTQEPVKPKPVKERDNLDLLELVCQLYGRVLAYRTKEMHDAYVEARNEMESRLTPPPSPVGIEDEEVENNFDEWVTNTWKESNNESAACRGAARYAFEWVYDYLKRKAIKAGYSASLPQSSTEKSQSGEGDAVDGWTNKKPVFKAEGDFVTASWWKDHWEYKAWSMIKIEGEDDDGNEGYYLGLCDQDGNEWGDYDDLTADLYFILPKPPIK